MTEGHSRGHLSWQQDVLTWSRQWRIDVTLRHQSSSKCVLETCIALHRMACYKRIAEICNISKTGHLHLCMGSITNLTKTQLEVLHFTTLHLASTKVNIYRIMPNNTGRSPSYRSWLWEYQASDMRFKLPDMGALLQVNNGMWNEPFAASWHCTVLCVNIGAQNEVKGFPYYARNSNSCRHESSNAFRNQCI